MGETRHRELEVWKRAIGLVKKIYQITKDFPVEERYGLIDQIRRAAVSVASNIAEGSGRQTPKDFVNFLSMARGSLAELDTQMVIAKELGYVSDIMVIVEEMTSLSKMINAFITSLKSKY